MSTTSTFLLIYTFKVVFGVTKKKVDHFSIFN